MFPGSIKRGWLLICVWSFYFITESSALWFSSTLTGGWGIRNNYRMMFVEESFQ